MKIITHNPYRILGVMSNARIKDIEKNKSLLKAFSAVNKSADFKSDLTALLGPVVRDQNAMSDAESSLSIPVDKLRYALFWFIATNDDEKNDIATLTPDNIHLTIDRWAATPGFVATHNRVVALLCANRYEDAVKAAKKEYAEYLSDLKSLFDPDGLLAIDAVIALQVALLMEDFPVSRALHHAGSHDAIELMLLCEFVHVDEGGEVLLQALLEGTHFFTAATGSASGKLAPSSPPSS
jgi:hypothetical protein